MDFMHDRPTDTRSVRTTNLIDGYSREGRGIKMDLCTYQVYCKLSYLPLFAPTEILAGECYRAPLTDLEQKPRLLADPFRLAI